MPKSNHLTVASSPRLYAIKSAKLQELENLSNQGLIDLYFGDVSHVCMQEYVPYVWQFPGEDVFVPSMKYARSTFSANRDSISRVEDTERQKASYFGMTNPAPVSKSEKEAARKAYEAFKAISTFPM